MGVDNSTIDSSSPKQPLLTRWIVLQKGVTATKTMLTIKDLTLTYDAINEERTFSEGDTLTGTVTMCLKKDTKVKSFFVKLKGDANVRWSRGIPIYYQIIYEAHARYFKRKHFFIPENTKDTEISKGNHSYKFSIKIPSGSLPSSFHGAHGRIVYRLEAKLSRSWRLDSNVKQEIDFASKAISSLLMTRQVGQVDKDIGIFSKRSVHMEAFVEGGVYAPGQTVAVTVKVKNTSSKDITPKFSLRQNVTYRVLGSTKYSWSEICKLVGEVIEKKSEKTVSCTLKIPPDTILSIQNCEILSVEHYLKVYLDISFATDPEINFPLVIAPSSFMLNPGPGGMNQPYPPVAYGGPSNSDFPPPCCLLSASSASAGLWSLSSLLPPSSLRSPAAFGPLAASGPPAWGPGFGADPQRPLAHPVYPQLPGAQPAPFPSAPGAMGTAYYKVRATEQVSMWTPGPALVARPRAPPFSPSVGPGSSTGGSGGSGDIGQCFY
ncbi:arrestin domain-containing protein 3-like [Gadus macrocephalus]|uniref:arrestin domain-containing protein 3-like n=1 Tax=Gadus macrocephalus TaxID=80720 RepID=UPI0028CB2597|nr:arrestin domain-containing protein 3-like [Gadus macrocephalus]